ncbi:MAG: hypothetical protein JJ913_15155 [Rhizobiaceae bacterium]|nr:hypothetical protein [Rhizobiaceae bacterium]
MMIIRARFLLPTAFALPFLIAQPAAAAEPITFAHKNWSDLRGILNVFDAFKQACLAQPVTLELPEELLPEGYQIVSSGLHALGFDTGSDPKAVVLSKTGDEEKDFAAGEPFIELGFPTDAAPNGECRVGWKRAWDYPDGLEKLIAGTGGVFDSWLSFQLKAVRVSRPDDMFGVGSSYSSVGEWAAPCLDSTWCRVSVLLTLTVEEGIYLTMTRGDPPTAPGGG